MTDPSRSRLAVFEADHGAAPLSAEAQARVARELAVRGPGVVQRARVRRLVVRAGGPVMAALALGVWATGGAGPSHPDGASPGRVAEHGGGRRCGGAAAGGARGRRTGVRVAAACCRRPVASPRVAAAAAFAGRVYETETTNWLGVVDATDASKFYLETGNDTSLYQAWHPDGQRLITTYGDPAELVLRDADAGRLATVNPDLCGGPGTVVNHPEFSPDGKLLALTREQTGIPARQASLPVTSSS